MGKNKSPSTRRRYSVISKGFEAQESKIASLSNRIASLEEEVGRLSRGKKRKAVPNPNKRFMTLAEAPVTGDTISEAKEATKEADAVEDVIEVGGMEEVESSNSEGEELGVVGTAWYLVFSSSATVYGSLADSGGRLVEESCTHTTTEWYDASGQARTTLSGCTGLTNPYGRTKWICEAILADLAAADPEWTVIALRYFNPIGCDDSGRLGEDPRVSPTNLMPVLLKVMLGEMDQLQIFGTDWDTRDGTSIRDFIHVSDLARGHLAALTVKNGQGFKTFNIGTGTGQTVYEVVDAIKAASGRDIPMIKVGRREGDVGVCVADPRRAMSELGWKPQKTLLDSCRDLCRYLQANGTNISG
ncbi:hypothetical protein BFJ68_g16897 [Fusarium oxysporum]|uniref:NAD-dependent epimerase/dehydratase domain-containing protein n=1 Tax=Fusarium oxysporum TaxID=5507 RepID=A0A420P809_FUSOX|nr:hypothetical protein BFJ68_g16897 [Fusarium oxysporum]